MPRPVRELKGFARVELQPGESRQVTLNLSASDFAFYDVNSRKWKADAGKYELQVGTSSRDIVLKTFFTLEKTVLVNERRTVPSLR